MIDYQICDKTNPFKYNEYTKEQNSLMFKYDSCYRFLIDDEKDFEEFKVWLNCSESSPLINCLGSGKEKKVRNSEDIGLVGNDISLMKQRTKSLHYGNRGMEDK